MIRTEAAANGIERQKDGRSKTKNSKSGHVPVSEILLASIRPSPENDHIYRPIDPSCPDLRALASSIRKNGVLDPIVVTRDGWILSGHRRHAAAQLAGLKTIPARIDAISRLDDRDRFVAKLREFNRQREKSLDEKLREELVSVDPDVAYQSLIEERKARSDISAPSLEIEGVKRRCRISKAKRPFLDAVLEVISDRKDYWPLSARQIHYALLNNPPLRHASKPDSRYVNDNASYKSLIDLLTRTRLEGEIPMEVVSDDTRPVTTWNVFREPGGFIRQQVYQFLKGYWRDLMQSQPNHIEVVCEKNTVDGILRTVVAKYGIPLTSGRGYCSLPPRHQIATRYRQSGMQRLILLIVSDHDPDGEEIAHSLARSMRDDFGISQTHPIKVALTKEQTNQFDLPSNLSAKVGSSNYRKFVERYGENVYELEALNPSDLQGLLGDAIDAVIDVDAFNYELNREHEDAAFLAGTRATVCRMLDDLPMENQ